MNPSLSFRLYHKQQVNKHKGAHTEVIKALLSGHECAVRECEDWEEEGMSLSSAFSALPLYSICEIKKAVISWKQIPCHTDGSVSSNGRLSRAALLCYQLVV